MIDRAARAKVAEACRSYVSGATTNVVFDDMLFALKSQDLAIEAIRRQLWLLYDDFQIHRNAGKWKLTSVQRDYVVRVIVFLKADTEYSWPTVPLWYSMTRFLIKPLSLGVGSKISDKKYSFDDHDSVWPFRDHEELELAKQQPRYLAYAV